MNHIIDILQITGLDATIIGGETAHSALNIDTAHSTAR